MRTIILATLILLFAFAPMVLAQDPTVEPTLEPVPELPEVMPELPPELPDNPLELLGFFEAFILFGAGLAAKYLTDVLKLIPGIGGDSRIRKQVVRAVATIAAVVVSVVTVYFTEAAGFLQESNLWAVILTVLSLQFGAHRADKLLRQVGARLLKQTMT